MDLVLEIVERANQRGGRMLSIIDLIEAGALTVARAAWLLERIEGGASWLVGAKPGGAGKTAVMCALLAMLPEGETVRLTNPGTGWEQSRPGECVVAYEISPGAYDAYIWGEDARLMARLGAAGCRVVSNLHADTLEEARVQIVRENGAAPGDFAAFHLFLPITVSASRPETWGSGARRVERRIERVHYAENGAWRELAPDAERANSARAAEIARFLETTREGGLRAIADVRRAWLQWTGKR